MCHWSLKQTGKLLQKLPMLSTLRFELKLLGGANFHLWKHEAACVGTDSVAAVLRLCIQQACSSKGSFKRT